MSRFITPNRSNMVLKISVTPRMATFEGVCFLNLFAAIALNGTKVQKTDLPKSGHLGRYRSLRTYFEPFGAILSHFGPFLKTLSWAI